MKRGLALRGTLRGQPRSRSASTEQGRQTRGRVADPGFRARSGSGRRRR
ncbi:hypothetical protein COLO4_04364 [Corchorus olitorius]|uniref:Uncharacterized protein n=1 Tax=Corchorus olitorius TaxID=93759 RepID=A0A1R3KUE4_9ROSI|nr:hypothetical protein COLO4_04364 [Corchorus olitorius]